MIKGIILNIEQNALRDRASDFAVSIAERFDAHIAGIAFAYSSIAPSLMMPEIPSSVVTSIIAENEKRAREAIGRFEAAAKRSLLSAEPYLVTRSESGPAEMFSSMARRFDLSVVMQSDHDSWMNNDLLIEMALFESGRPLVVVPYTQRERLKLEKIVCCWDGSRTAARAINDALPFLKRAQAVELLTVSTEKNHNGREVPGIDIGAHLARHDIKVEVESIPAADIDVTNAILSHVSDCSADMIVIGGYGHSRLREFVLGGVTRQMLSTMTVPVLMSH